MSAIPPTKMTVVYVASTGHIVAAVTRRDTTSPSPSVADLVGDGIHLRMATAPTTSSGPVGTFVIPPSDLASVDVDFDQVGTLPWARAINPPTVSSSSGQAQPIVNNRLMPFPTSALPAVSPPKPGSPVSVTIVIPTTMVIPTGSTYYIVFSQPATMTGAPPTASGPLSSSGTTTVPFPNLTLPTTTSGTSYPVLILVPTMLPYVENLAL